MKRVLLCLAASVLTFTAAAASAQPGRDDRHGPGPARHDVRHWRKGERLDPRFHSRGYMVGDWRRHGWRAPPRGYAYYRTDSGDVVLAAVASGVVASVIANALAH